MSEKKITVDLDLFKIPNKTRKKKEPENKDGMIRFKNPQDKKKNDTLKKRSILKMIRQHQEERYKKLFDKDDKKVNNIENNSFHKDFDEAQQFLQSLTEKKKQTNLNNTIRNYSPSKSLLFHPSVDSLQYNEPVQLNTILPSPNSNPMMTLSSSMQHITPPKYGCLKNGTLPTYRNLMNQTRKTHETNNQVVNVNPINPIVIGGSSQNPIQQIQKTREEIVNNKQDIISAETNKILEQKINNSIQRVNEMKEASEKLQQLKRDFKPKKMKRRRTIRRTYKIGKSKVKPKVSVLVSNKTIRSGILTKSQLLKQTPIEEVKRFLINRGLIKVGSITPNDVLRKMYESSIMICGDIYNHNPDNLLYNFMNDVKI